MGGGDWEHAIFGMATFGAEKFGTHSYMPRQNMVQNSQIVAQETSIHRTATVGFLMLVVIS